MTGWNIDHEWRCISYWTWAFSNVILVFRGVDPWDFARNSGCQEASVALGLFWIGEYHKLQSSWWRGRGFWRFEVNLLGFFTRKIAPYNLFFFKVGDPSSDMWCCKKKRSHALFLLIEWSPKEITWFSQVDVLQSCLWGSFTSSSSWVIDVFLLVKMLPPKKYRPSSGIFVFRLHPPIEAVLRPLSGWAGIARVHLSSHDFKLIFIDPGTPANPQS